MHKFLRAIGFSDITKKDLEMILDEVIARPEIMKITKDSEGNEFAELSGSFVVPMRKMTVSTWIIIIRICLEPVSPHRNRLMWKSMQRKNPMQEYVTK